MTAIILTLAIVHGLSLISPGPDFFLVLRNSLLRSRTAGRVSALGIIIGNVFYITLALAITFFVTEKFGTAFLTILKIAGGLYLLYLSFQILKSSLFQASSGHQELDEIRSENLLKTFFIGLGSTVLNAKAAIYFLSVVPQFINPERSIQFNLVLYFEFIALSAIWFFGVAEVAAYPWMRLKLERSFQAINISLGLIFLIFGGFLLADVRVDFL